MRVISPPKTGARARNIKADGPVAASCGDLATVGAVEKVGTFVLSTVEGGVSNCGAYTYVVSMPPDELELDEEEVVEADPLPDEELELVPLPEEELLEEVPVPELDEEEPEEDEDELPDPELELEDDNPAFSAAIFSFSVLKY